MNIALVADFKNKDQINGGYFYASQSIKSSLQLLKSKRKIKNLTFLELSEINKYKYTQKFDYCFIICNPNSIITNINYFKNLFAVCNKKYLHILWETSPLPESWKPLWTMDYFTGFFTPSMFFKELIEKETDKIVYYTPYGIDTTKDVININNKKEEEKFTILVTGQVTKRKGIEDAITGYIRAFSNFPNDTQLILKCFRLSKHEDSLEDLIIKKSFMNSKSPNSRNLRIFTLDKNISRDEIMDLYKKSSILLTPSRGEGFSLPCLEAMSVGLPVIYTDWSNMPEVCDPENIAKQTEIKDIVNVPLRYVLDEAIDMLQYNYEINTNYAIPIMKDIINALRMKYSQWAEDKEKYYKDAKANIELVKKYFSFDKVNEYYEKIIGEDE
jgi:glycosyltransferase involved in cell wall biosynthesis